MINEENIIKMYNGLIENKELTTKELNSYGFNSKDLSNLIENGTLKRIKRGYYSIVSVDNLFLYGKKLIAQKEYEKATSCFEKCYEIDSIHTGVNFQLFLRSVQSKDYTKAFEYFEVLYNSDNEYYNSNNNFYLYLLSMITEVPKKHKEYAKFLRLEDFKVKANDYNNIPLQNKVIISAFNQQFIVAYKQLNELIELNGRLSVQDILIKTLLKHARELQIKNRNQVLNLLKEKDYEGVIKFLEGLQECHNLSFFENNVLLLSNDLLGIIKEKVIPEKQVFDTNNLFAAIDGKNYQLALSLAKEYSKKVNIDNESNIIYLLLNDIDIEINKLKEKNISVEQENVFAKITPAIQITEEIEKQSTNIKTSTNFVDIINFLMNQEIESSLKALREYLTSIDRKQYEFLIVDLIKISLIENDIAFTKPMVVLTYVSGDNFKLNISEYLQNFYEALAQSKFEIARLYLDIISNSNKIGHFGILTDQLEQVLNNIEKVLDCKKDSNIQNSIIENSSNEVAIKSVDSSQTAQQISIPKKVVKTNNKSNNVISKDYDDREFIQQKLYELYENGIVLLKPMDSERRKQIHNIVKDIPDVVSFSIGTNNLKQVVLRFKPYIDESLDFGNLIKIGTDSYKCGDYDTCISTYRRMLEFGTPKAAVYAKIGLAYIKKFKIDIAIDYLTIATYLGKQENKGYDYTDLIERLKGNVNEEDKKAFVKMEISDFYSDVDEYYGINNVREIADLISSGMNIENACESIGLDDEQKNIMILIYARECYYQENYNLGDIYLKKIEQIKNKSKFVKSLYEEIRKNKNFYKNRNADDSNRLTLSKYKK